MHETEAYVKQQYKEGGMVCFTVSEVPIKALKSTGLWCYYKLANLSIYLHCNCAVSEIQTADCVKAV